MTIIRKDYLLDRYVYYATKRGKRPHEFVKNTRTKFPKFDLFGVGNEKLIPEEIGHVDFKGSWLMRWIPNKFPAVELKGKPKFTGSQLFRESKGYGKHELIIETRDQRKKLGDLPVSDVALLLRIYAERIRQLQAMDGIRYVQVFKNHGPQAGASIIHEHSQIIAIPQVPPGIKEKVTALRQHKTDIVKTILAKEMKSKRRIRSTKKFVSFCPFASRFNYEAWIYPKEKITSFDEFGNTMFQELALHVKPIIEKLQLMDASYNMCVHYCPYGDDMRLHIEIMPRIATWAGFELGTECIINSVLPEDAAAYYRST